MDLVRAKALKVEILKMEIRVLLFFPELYCYEEYQGAASQSYLTIETVEDEIIVSSRWIFEVLPPNIEELEKVLNVDSVTWKYPSYLW
jgi:hypothetical protein